jgi:hypothetical protein
LKAVVIAGNALTVAAIIYNDGYHPGTNDLLTTIGLACLAQDLTGCRYESLILRPVFDDTRSDSPDIPFDANHLDAIILAHEKTLWTKLVGLLHRHRLKSISVSLSSVSTCHVGYVTYFLGEVLTMQQLPAKNQRMSKIQMGKSSWGSSIGTELNVIWPKLEFNVKSAARRYLAGVSKLVSVIAMRQITNWECGIAHSVSSIDRRSVQILSRLWPTTFQRADQRKSWYRRHHSLLL